MSRLLNKVALVTGGGGGIGAEIASLFCSEGAAVFLVDADAAALELTMKSVLQALPNARISGSTANVADVRGAQHAVGQAIEQYGKLDALINNAAMRNYAPVADASIDEWNTVVGVNLIGCANYCKAALPALRASGKGSIVNVSSCYAVTGRKGMGIYDSTKAGMLALTRTLAFEEAAHGVRANAICPGSTLTDFHIAKAKASGKSVEQLAGERQDTSLLARWASPREIALPILWLASDEGSFITGTTLMVDGGLHVM
jgi:meso-butanediol dehydrogenase/(S,S)-butanediol dehydrogenase/diacetyl reductase